MNKFINTKNAYERLLLYKETSKYQALNDRYKLSLDTYIDTFSGKIKDDF